MARSWIGAAYVEIDALPDQLNVLLRPRGISRQLPPRGGLSDATQIERDMVDRVLRPDARKIKRMARKFRIEPDIGLIMLIVELHVAQHRNVGPQVAQIQHLAPTVVADDDVGRVAEVLQACRGTIDGFGPPDAVIEFAGRDVGFLDIQIGMGVGHFANAHHFVRVRFADEHNLVPFGGDEMSQDMHKLRWKVLMNKQELQSDALRLIAAPGEPKRTAVRAAAAVRARLGALSAVSPAQSQSTSAVMETKRAPLGDARFLRASG